MYKKILLAVDGSEHSLRATDEVIKIVSSVADCEVEILLVIEYDKAKKEVLHASGKEELEMIRRKRVLPSTKKLQEHQISYTIQTLYGEPGPTIVDYANNDHFDLLVIGSRGLNMFQEMVLGSVSHKVVKRANCPVLVVK